MPTIREQRSSSSTPTSSGKTVKQQRYITEQQQYVEAMKPSRALEIKTEAERPKFEPSMVKPITTTPLYKATAPRPQIIEPPATRRRVEMTDAEVAPQPPSLISKIGESLAGTTSAKVLSTAWKGIEKAYKATGAPKVTGGAKGAFEPIIYPTTYGTQPTGSTAKDVINLVTDIGSGIKRGFETPEKAAESFGRGFENVPYGGVTRFLAEASLDPVSYAPLPPVKKLMGLVKGLKTAKEFEEATPMINQLIGEAEQMKSTGLIGTQPSAIAGAGTLKPLGAEETLNRVMERVKPIVTERITPPLENHNELAKWVKSHLGENVSLNEVRSLPYEDLRQLAEDVRSNTNIANEAYKAASELGYDLPKLLEGQAPSINEKVTRQAQERVAGIYPKELPPVSKPIINKVEQTKPTTEVPKVSEEVQAIAIKPSPIVEPAQGERAYMGTLEQSGRLQPEAVQAMKESEKRFYEKVTNVEALNTANERISQGIDKAEADLLGKEKYNHEDVATGIRLIDELQKSGNVQRAVTVAENLSKQLTEAGQTIQAASIVNRLSPDGALLYATRRVNEIGKTLKTEDASKILDLANASQKAGISVERSTNVMDIADKLKRKETLTTDELHKLTSFVEDTKSMLGTPKKVKTEKPVKLPSDKKIREQLLTSLNEKEAALQEFIRINSKRVSSTPLDLWGAYAALGAVKMAKGAISFSKWSEQMIKDVGEGIKPHLSNLFDRSQEEAKQLQHLMPDKIAAEKVAQKYIDADRLTPKDAQSIHDLASRIGKMSTNDKQAASREIQSILNTYEKSSIGDKVNALRYIAMLGNTSTQLVNAISSPIMMLERYMLDAIQTPFDIARSKITGGPRRVTFKQGPEVWNNFFTPISDYTKGAKIGGESGWRGIDPNGITSQTDIKGLAFKSKWNPARWAEGGLGAVMKGADYGSYNSAVQMKLRQMAYLDALNTGLKDTQEIKNYMDRYLNNLDSNIVDVADRFGKEMTFQTKGKLAQAGQMVQRGLNLGMKTGLGSAILPFVKTPMNILAGGLERTPAGFLKGIYQLSTMAKNPNITLAEIQNTFAKALFGSVALTGTGYVLGNLGILTGDTASKEKDMKALEADVGKGKFKFNTTAFARMMDALIHGNVDQVKEVSQFQPGDNQLNYNKIQPLAFPIAAGATFATQKQQAEVAQARGEEGISLRDQLLNSLAASGQSIYDMSFLKGLQDAFDVNPGEGIGGTLTQIGQNYLKSFAPSALAQEARRQDVEQRQVTTQGLTEPVTQYFQSRLPGQSQQLPPKVTTLGETIKNTPGIIGNYLNPLQKSEAPYNQASKVIYDLIQKTGDEKLAPSPVEKTVTGKKDNKSTTIKLTTKQIADLQQSTGKEIAKRVLTELKGLTPDKASAKLEKIYSDVREIERNKVKKELGLK